MDVPSDRSPGSGGCTGRDTSLDVGGINVGSPLAFATRLMATSLQLKVYSANGRSLLIVFSEEMPIRRELISYTYEELRLYYLIDREVNSRSEQERARLVIQKILFPAPRLKKLIEDYLILDKCNQTVGSFRDATWVAQLEEVIDQARRKFENPAAVPNKVVKVANKLNNESGNLAPHLALIFRARSELLEVFPELGCLIIDGTDSQSALLECAAIFQGQVRRISSLRQLSAEGVSGNSAGISLISARDLAKEQRDFAKEQEDSSLKQPGEALHFNLLLVVQAGRLEKVASRWSEAILIDHKSRVVTLGKSSEQARAGWGRIKLGLAALVVCCVAIGIFIVNLAPSAKRTPVPSSTSSVGANNQVKGAPKRREENERKIRFPFNKPSPLAVRSIESTVSYANRNSIGSQRFGRIKHVLDAQESSKYILVYFWATWCTPCMNEMPEIENLAEKMSGDFVLIGVADEIKTTDRSLITTWRRMKDALGSYEHLDAQYILERGKALNVEIFGNAEVALPAFALFDRQGELITVFHGAITSDVGRRQVQLMEKRIDDTESRNR